MRAIKTVLLSMMVILFSLVLLASSMCAVADKLPGRSRLGSLLIAVVALFAIVRGLVDIIRLNRTP